VQSGTASDGLTGRKGRRERMAGEGGKPPAAGKEFTLRSLAYVPLVFPFRVSVPAGIGRAITRRIKTEETGPRETRKGNQPPPSSRMAFAFIFSGRMTRAR